MGTDSSLTYIKGDATIPYVEGGRRVIVHCCNDEGKWGKGFVTHLSKKWTPPEQAYRKWYASVEGNLPLGEIQPVQVSDDTFVMNLIGQKGVYKSGSKPPIRYWALKRGFRNVYNWVIAQEAEVTLHMPKLGSGLAGGNWSRIEELIKEELSNKNISVTIYTL